MPGNWCNLDNLSKTVRSSARNVLHGHSCRHTSSGLRTKQFCGNKTSTTSYTHVILTISLCQTSVGTHITGGGQYICPIVWNLFRCYCAKNYRNRSIFDYVIATTKSVQFFKTQCISSNTLCLNNTRPLQLIWHNYTNSQHLLTDRIQFLIEYVKSL